MSTFRVAQITDSIISEVRASMSSLYYEPSDFLVLRKIVYLAVLHGHNSPKRTIYATPGQEYIAKACDLSRATVSRRSLFLKEKGLLAITYRRKVKGEFQTNLYRFGAVLWAMIQDVTRRFNSYFSRVTPVMHIVPLNRINTSSSVSKIHHDTELEAIFERIERKFSLKEGSPHPEPT